MSQWHIIVWSPRQESSVHISRTTPTFCTCRFWNYVKILFSLLFLYQEFFVTKYRGIPQWNHVPGSSSFATCCWIATFNSKGLFIVLVLLVQLTVQQTRLFWDTLDIFMERKRNFKLHCIRSRLYISFLSIFVREKLYTM